MYGTCSSIIDTERRNRYTKCTAVKPASKVTSESEKKDAYII